MILVVGDSMIDEYVTVAVDRISPEAPVPVMRLISKEERPGGAANVAANIEAMGSPVFLVKTPSRIRPRKTRFVVASGQQIARLDEETTEPLNVIQEKYLIDEILFSYDISAIVISDYAKGVCTDFVCRTVIKAGKQSQIPVIVDPKRADWGVYEGATVITPNEREWATQHRSIYQRFPNVLVTLGKDGMVLMMGEGSALPIPAEEVSVADVTGAGDTVVAALAVGLSRGMSLIDACRLANRAAGIVVSKRGTSVVTMEEIDAHD